jgi:tetratricopeptide (TPR) repeat protein
MPAVSAIVFLVLACDFPGLTNAWAWSQEEAHAQHETIGWIPREILERPAPLRDGIGKIHEEVTTASPKAQAYYDQGLAYLESFVWIEAARSFHEALRLDPHMAMAYLGLSDVFLALQDVPAAQEAVQSAQSRAIKVSERDRRRIEIRARQIEFLEDSQDMQKYFAYRKAIEDALAVRPADPWFWILRGFADETSPYGHGQGGGVDTIAFYETALHLSPDNFAAHHYLIHTFENLGRIQEALLHAEAYVRLAPSIPHAHHMLGHDLRRLGRTQEALREFIQAGSLEDAYYQSEKIPAVYDWHHAHNLALVATCYQSLGQLKTAEKLLRESFAQPAYTDLAGFNRQNWPEFLLGRGRAQEALEAAQDLLKSQSPMVLLAGHTLAGRALLAMGRLDDVRNELRLAEQQESRLPSAAKGLPLADALRAELLLSEQRRETAEQMLKEVEERIRAVPGPDAWVQALFQMESIAHIARDNGAWDLAEYTAQQMIDHDPSYAGGYYALGLVAEHAGKSALAQQQFAKAETLWSKADPDLPELQYLQRTLATPGKPQVSRK